MEKGSDEQVDRQSKTVGNTLERKRAASRIALEDVRKFRRDGLVEPSLIPLTKMAEDEAREVIASLGGPDCISEAERLVVEDLARLGIILRAELGVFMGGGSGAQEAAKQATSVAAARRTSLLALGLGRREQELLSAIDANVTTHDEADEALSTRLDQFASAGRTSVVDRQADDRRTGKPH